MARPANGPGRRVGSRFSSLTENGQPGVALAAPPALPLSGDTLSLACEHAPLAAGPLTRVPCLHAISEARLLALYLAGLRRLGVVSGTCATCPRTSSPKNSPTSPACVKH